MSLRDNALYISYSFSFSSAFVPLNDRVRYSRPLASLVFRDKVRTSAYDGCDGDSLPVGLSRGSVTGAVITAENFVGVLS